MATAPACSCNRAWLPSVGLCRQELPFCSKTTTTRMRKQNSIGQQCGRAVVKCGIGDFLGGDYIRFDLGKWLSDVEEHKALAIYPPHEGGAEGRYFTRLRYQGYHFLDVSARGLGDPETTLTKIHPVCPAHLGKQPIARWYFPPEVDYRLSLLPPNAKGLVVWVIEAKVLSKAELQFLALLPTLRPKVRVIAECGNWYVLVFCSFYSSELNLKHPADCSPKAQHPLPKRRFMWKPLKEIAGLTTEGQDLTAQQA